MHLNIDYSKELDIISIGECMVEFFPVDNMDENFRMSFGGDTLNVIAAASKLGTRTGYITKLGNDVFGDYLLSNFINLNIDVSNIKRDDNQTGLYFILNQQGKNQFLYYRKNSSASTLQYEDIATSYLKRSKILHTSGITQAISPSCRQVVKKVFANAKKLGAVTSYDPNLRLKLCSLSDARNNLTEILDHTDIMFLKVPYESSQLLGIDSEENICKYLHSKGVEIIILKVPDKDCLISYEGRIETIRTSSIDKATDTSGAGDALAGAFLAGICNEIPYTDALRTAVKFARESVKKQGTIISF